MEFLNLPADVDREDSLIVDDDKVPRTFPCSVLERDRIYDTTHDLPSNGSIF